MKTSCPNCGAPLEFRFDDSFVRVCDHCKTAVLRTDRGLDTLGQVADLTPIESPLRLFSEGHYGKGTFLLVGMAQIRHSAGGIWQEWYAKLGGGTWGWLAEAQGRYYLTFEHRGEVALPPIDSLAPGAVVELPVPGRLVPSPFTVAEVTTGMYIAARGELPFKLAPNGSFRYVDLADGHGLFATIDYGDEPPSLYVGQQISLADLKMTGGEVEPVAQPAIRSTRLACPNCNAPVELHLPGESLRVVCGHCNTILGVDSDAVRVVAAQKTRAQPEIPLGTKAAFPEGEQTVIGFVERSALVDGDWWPFHEYLLHSPALGFRWLVESDGNWSYVQPVATGAVTVGVDAATYERVNFRVFQRGQLRVDVVLGELYWPVAVGELVESEDLIAPPAMLSREANGSEENWSLGTYLTARELAHALGKLPLAKPSAIAPNQVDASARGASLLTIAFAALLAIGLFASARAANTIIYDHAVEIPSGTPPPPPADVVEPATAPAPAPADTAPNPYVFFSEPFELEAGKNVLIGFSTNLNNNWAYMAADLVNVATGEVVSVDAELDYYSGYEDGESWSEGSLSSRTVIGPPSAGQYMLRVESQHGGSAQITAYVQVRQGVFRGKYLALACLVLGIPWFAFGLHAWTFERKRWDQSSFGTAAMPKTTVWFAALSVIGIGIAITVLIFSHGGS